MGSGNGNCHPYPTFPVFPFQPEKCPELCTLYFVLGGAGA